MPRKTFTAPEKEIALNNIAACATDLEGVGMVIIICAKPHYQPDGVVAWGADVLVQKAFDVTMTDIVDATGRFLDELIQTADGQGDIYSEDGTRDAGA